MSFPLLFLLYHISFSPFLPDIVLFRILHMDGGVKRIEYILCGRDGEKDM